MGLAFYLAESRRAINLETEYANLPSELYDYMYRHSDELPPEAAFFYRLDPYGEESFDCEQARYIAELCDALLGSPLIPDPPEASEPQKNPGHDAEDGDSAALPPFLLRLRELCGAACESRSHIIMLGD